MWAAIWKRLPKVVFSTTLTAVQGNARLASGGLAEEIERLRAEPGEGDIAIGGATLAAEAAASGLIYDRVARQACLRTLPPQLVGLGRLRPLSHETISCAMSLMSSPVVTLCSRLRGHGGPHVGRVAVFGGMAGFRPRSVRRAGRCVAGRAGRWWG